MNGFGNLKPRVDNDLLPITRGADRVHLASTHHRLWRRLKKSYFDLSVASEFAGGLETCRARR